MSRYEDIHRALERTVDPVGEPVTTAEAKATLNVTSADDDAYIGTLITAARIVVENETGKSLLTQTYIQYLDRWPDYIIRLPAGPVQAVNSVKYYDEDGVLQTWASATEYWSDLKPHFARIVPRDGVSFPDLQAGRPAAIEIDYDAGYGVAADVPEDIKLAIKALVAVWYRVREPVQDSQFARVPAYLDYLLRALGQWEF